MLVSNSESQLVFEAWALPPSLASWGILPFSVSALEGLTTFFEVDLSAMSEENPVLPETLSPLSYFVDVSYSVDITADKQYYLSYWDFQNYYPDESVGGAFTPEQLIFYASWHYTDVPPGYNPGYLLPYLQSESETPDGTPVFISGVDSGGYSLRLFQRTEHYTEETGLIKCKWLFLHEMGGPLDLSGWTFQLDAYGFPDVRQVVVDPENIDYMGTNLASISSAFTALLDYHSGGVYPDLYYNIELSGGSLKQYRPALGKVPPDPVGLPVIPILPPSPGKSPDFVLPFGGAAMSLLVGSPITFGGEPITFGGEPVEGRG